MEQTPPAEVPLTPAISARWPSSGVGGTQKLESSTFEQQSSQSVDLAASSDESEKVSVCSQSVAVVAPSVLAAHNIKRRPRLTYLQDEADNFLSFLHTFPPSKGKKNTAPVAPSSAQDPKGGKGGKLWTGYHDWDSFGEEEEEIEEKEENKGKKESKVSVCVSVCLLFPVCSVCFDR